MESDLASRAGRRQEQEMSQFNTADVTAEAAGSAKT